MSFHDANWKRMTINKWRRYNLMAYSLLHFYCPFSQWLHHSFIRSIRIIIGITQKERDGIHPIICQSLPWVSALGADSVRFLISCCVLPIAGLEAAVIGFPAIISNVDSNLMIRCLESMRSLSVCFWDRLWTLSPNDTTNTVIAKMWTATNSDPDSMK